MKTLFHSSVTISPHRAAPCWRTCSMRNATMPSSCREQVGTAKICLSRSRRMGVLVLTFQHDGDNGPGIIAGAAERPQADRFTTTIAMNVHQHLEMNPVRVRGFARGESQHPEQVPQPASQGLTALQFEQFTLSIWLPASAYLDGLRPSRARDGDRHLES